MKIKTQSFVYIATSLDGFIAKKDGNLDFLTEPTCNDSIDSKDNGNNKEDFGYHAFMNSMDVLVMGRKTFEKVLSFTPWPYENKRVVVLSSQNLEIPKSLSETVEALNLPPRQVVEHLAAQGAKKLYIDGGNTIQRFLNEGLIYEMIITRIPILIGEGTPLFGALCKDIKVQHVETKQFKNGFVQSRYKVKDV